MLECSRMDGDKVSQDLHAYSGSSPSLAETTRWKVLAKRVAAEIFTPPHSVGRDRFMAGGWFPPTM